MHLILMIETGCLLHVACCRLQVAGWNEDIDQIAYHEVQSPKTDIL